MGLKVESICSTMKHLAREVDVELQHEGRRLDAVCALYLPLTEYKSSNPITPSPLSIDTLGDKRNLPGEKRFKALKRQL